MYSRACQILYPIPLFVMVYRAIMARVRSNPLVVFQPAEAQNAMGEGSLRGRIRSMAGSATYTGRVSSNRCPPVRQHVASACCIHVWGRAISRHSEQMQLRVKQVV